jgi:predicted Zn-dependent protease
MHAHGLPARAFAALLALALAAPGCITRAQEAKLGEDEAKKVEQEMGLLRGEPVEGTVRAIGEKLAAASTLPEGPWQFLVVDAPEPNAFALPGGYVYVTRGLLALVNSEDELAGVIGHEIGHVTARHSAKRIGAAVLTAPVSIAAGIAGLAVGIVSPLLGSVVVGTGQVLTGGLVIAPFSREQEHQADEVGQGLAAKVGYDPAGLSTFLRTLDREVALQAGKPSRFHFLDSHPMTPDRIDRTAERAQRLARGPARPVAGSRAHFLARLDGLVVGVDPAQGVFEESLFLHPELDFAISFPTGWETVNTTQAAGAVSPGKDALVALRLAAADRTLDDVLAELAQEQKDLRFERLEIRGLPASRTRIAERGQVADVTLVGYGGNVYAVVGQCAESTIKNFASAFDASARSFRALRAKERARIRESRLRVREARGGETPAALAQRTESSWKPEQLAVANAVDPGTAFRAGQPVKVAIPQPYTRRAR